MTSTGYRLVLAITGLSLAHHLDHAWRGVTGWPLDGGFNPFAASLSGGGALFILAVHVGPAAGDSVTSIPGQYASPAADAAALAVLAAFFAALVGHCVHEVRRSSRAPAK